MQIRCQTHDQAVRVIQVLDQYLARSRFNLNGHAWFGGDNGMTIRTKGRRTWVVINGVRLNIPKGYCGNHCGPCQVRFGGAKKHKTLPFLEGLDWVSFDDMVNDALDSIHHDGDVASGVCVVRKGKRRRMDYYGRDGGEFDREGYDYEDFCGRTAPPSEYQEGTPGIIGWGKECTEAPFEEAEAV